MAGGGGYGGASYAGRSYGGTVSAPVSAQTILAVGVATAESVNQPKLVQLVNPLPSVSTEAFGVIATSLTVPFGGIAAGQVGSPRVNLTVPLLATPSAETVTQPVLTQTEYRTMAGADSSFASGLISTSLSIPMGSADSAEAFGGVRIGRGFLLGSVASAEAFGVEVVAYSLPMATVDSAEAVGLLSTSLSVPMRAIASDETWGRPSPPAQGINMAAAAPSEAFGEPTAANVYYLASAPSAAQVGDVNFTVGPVTIHASGIPPGFAAGGVSIDVAITMQGAVSLAAVSTFLPVRVQHFDVLGAASSEAVGAPTVPVRPTAIPSETAVGVPTVSVALNVRAVGVASGEQLGAPFVGDVVAVDAYPWVSQVGAPALSFSVSPLGVAPGDVGLPTFSTTQQDQTLALVGATSAEDIGLATVGATIAPVSVASAEAIGLVVTERILVLRGVAPAEAVGRPRVQTVTVAPAGIATAEAVGAPEFPVPQFARIGSAATAETFGAFAWTRGIIFYLLGVPPEAEPGNVYFGFGPVYRSMQGAASAASVSPAHYFQSRAVPSIDSAEAVGAPVLVASAAPLSIPTQEAVGRPARPLLGAVTRSPTSIGSAEAVSGFRFPQTIVLSGIASTEVAGQPQLAAVIRPVGVGSSESVSAVSLASSLFPLGVASTEAVNGPRVDVTVPMGGVDSTEIVPSPQVAFSVATEGIPSAEAAGEISTSITVPLDGIAAGLPGTPAISVTVPMGPVESAELVGDPTLHAVYVAIVAAIESAEAVGQPSTEYLLALTGAISAETWGAPQLYLHIDEFPAGAPTGEWFGQPNAPAYTEQLGSIDSGEAAGDFLTHLTVNFDGIPSDEAAGEPSLYLLYTALVADVASEEAFGVYVTDVSLPMLGIASGEGVGAPTDRVSEPVEQIGSEEVVNGPQVNITVPLATVASAETIGLPAPPIYTEYLGAAASGEAVGQPRTTYGNEPAGVDSEEAFGQPTLYLSYNVATPSIDPPDGVGTPKVHQGIAIAGAASAAAFGAFGTYLEYHISLLFRGIHSFADYGTPRIVGNFDVAAGTVPTAETVGRPQQVAQAVHPVGVPPGAVGSVQLPAITVAMGGVASAERFSGPAIGPVSHIFPAGLGSAESVSAPKVLPGQLVHIGGVATAAATGAPGVALSNRVAVRSVASAEAPGAPRINQRVVLGSVPSAEALGAALVLPGQLVRLVGVASSEAEGLPGATTSVMVTPIGVSTVGTVPQPRIVRGVVVLLPVGIDTREAAGQPLVAQGAAVLSPVSITPGQPGAPSVIPGPVYLLLEGVAAQEAVSRFTTFVPGSALVDLDIGVSTLAVTPAVSGRSLMVEALSVGQVADAVASQQDPATELVGVNVGDPYAVVTVSDGGGPPTWF